MSSPLVDRSGARPVSPTAAGAKEPPHASHARPCFAASGHVVVAASESSAGRSFGSRVVRRRRGLHRASGEGRGECTLEALPTARNVVTRVPYGIRGSSGRHLGGRGRRPALPGGTCRREPVGQRSSTSNTNLAALELGDEAGREPSPRASSRWLIPALTRSSRRRSPIASSGFGSPLACCVASLTSASSHRRCRGLPVHRRVLEQEDGRVDHIRHRHEALGRRACAFGPSGPGVGWVRDTGPDGTVRGSDRLGASSHPWPRPS